MQNTITRIEELEKARAELQSAIEDADADHRNASSYREEMDCYHAFLDARDALEAWDSSDAAAELASLRAILDQFNLGANL